MSRVRKAACLCFVLLGGLLSLLIVVALVVPRVIDLVSLRDRITAQLSARVGGQVRSDALHVSLLPLPSAVLDHVSLSVPGTLDATLASISVHPRLLPLLRAQLRLAEVRLQSPQIIIRRLPQGLCDNSRWVTPDTVASVLADVSLLALSPAAGVTLAVNDGAIELPAGSSGAIRFDHIDGRVGLSPDRLGIELQCASNLWKRLSVNASMNPTTAEGGGRIEVSELRPQLIGAQRLPGGLQLGDSAVNLALNAEAHGVRVLRVEVDALIPALTVRHGDDEAVLRSARLGAIVDLDGGVVHAILRPSQLDYPRMRLSGSLSVTPDAAQLEIGAAEVDVDAVRQVALLVGSHVPVVRAILNVLRGGVAPEITLRSHASTLAELNAVQGLNIQGRLVGGRVHVPGVNLDLENVAGDVTVAGGVLSAERVSAQLAKSQATGGTLRIGLSGATPELHVNTRVDADAGETAALLRRLVAAEALRREFQRVREIAGTVSGTLSVDGTTDTVAVTAETSAFALSGRMDGLRSPLQIEGGHFSYSAGRIEASDMTVSAGASRLSEVALRTLPSDRASLEATAGASQIALDEVYPWLQASGWLPQSRWNPRSLNGTLSLDFVRLARVPENRGEWQFEVIGSAQKLVIESAELRQRIATQSPVSLSGLHVRHDAKTGTSFAAKVAAPGNLTGAVEGTWNGDRLDLANLSIQDAESDASLTLQATPADLSLTFKGRVTKTTLDTLLEHDLLAGSIRGDFRAHIERNQPAWSTLDGRVEAQGVTLSLGAGRHLTIETLSLNGVDRRVSGNATIDTMQGDHLELKGRLERAAQIFNADIDLTAGHLDWNTIAPWISHDDGAGGPNTSTSWAQSLRGKMRVAAESFSYNGFTWKPMRAVVAFTPRALTMTVSDATVCGVSTPGKIVVTPQGVTVAVKPVAKKQSLDALLPCVGLSNNVATGRYSLAAEMTACGAPKELTRSLRGQVQFNATNGRLYRTGIAGRILSVLSVATGAVWTASDITKEDLRYDKLSVKADLNAGRLVLKEATLNGPSVKCVAEGSVDLTARTLNLALLVAPLKTVDAVVSQIPVISGILGGSLVSIPIKVSGDLADPKVTPLPASAVGKGLLNVMTRTLKLPMKVIEPVMPEGAKPSDTNP